MLRAIEIILSGSWDSARRRSTVMLDFDHRCRRRIVLTGEDGLAFLLDLPAPRHLRDGDGLVLEDGGIVRVRAADEPLLELKARNSAELVRLAWHLGNRHVPTELRPDGLRIREDHVLAGMARGLGAEVSAVSAPFNPEGGAYGERGGGPSHGHGHHHHDHDQGHHDHPQPDNTHQRQDGAARLQGHDRLPGHGHPHHRHNGSEAPGEVVSVPGGGRRHD